MRIGFFVTVFICLMSAAQAADYILIRRANIFDGRSEQLLMQQDVLLRDTVIAKIGSGLKAPDGAQIIDANGLTLSPGFIDSHTHIMLQLSYIEGLMSDPYFWAYQSTQIAQSMLMNGFTTIRDMSGNSYSLKKAIDRGLVVGPRIFPSGPMISQTSGHSDHRFDSHPSRLVSDQKSVFQDYNMVAIADGRAEVLMAARESLRRGASQVKIAVGGGASSAFDPIDVVQYTLDEMKAAVDAAGDYGTYVAAHAYTDAAITRAIEAGVKTIEHGNLASPETLKLMQKNNVWLSPQVIVFTEFPRTLNALQRAKLEYVASGLDSLFKNVKKSGFQNIVFGTDIVMDPQLVKNMNREFTHRAKWFSPLEVLQQATSKGGEMLALSGKRSPYAGRIGVIAEGALADILLIRGNPLNDLSILTDPDKNLALIIKGGKIFKNQLAE
jgi:imidazolonepropionase-like amidohydrolase